MPFIKQLARKALDKLVKEGFFYLTANGNLNYFLVKLMLRRRQQEGECYQFYKCYIAELRDAADEIFYFYQLPYEKKKREENGDVEE